jgi:hypothetical protein
VSAVKPERAHTLIVSMGANTAEDLAWGLRHMADDIERGQLTVGASGSPSVGSIYSYRIRPEQTHDVYFRELDEWLQSEHPAKGGET